MLAGKTAVLQVAHLLMGSSFLGQSSDKILPQFLGQELEHESFKPSTPPKQSKLKRVLSYWSSVIPEYYRNLLLCTFILNVVILKDSCTLYYCLQRHLEV